jgi:WD40 repeat protein
MQASILRKRGTASFSKANQKGRFKMRLIPLVAALAVMGLRGISSAFAQGAPNLVWEVPTPNILANSIQGVSWSPVSAQLAVGSTDRWVRTRQASNGSLVYSVLQPIRSGGANQTIYSTDGFYLAVHNRSGGLGYRVHRALDGVFLGTLTATIESNGLVRFAPDAQLISAVGGDGTISRWRIAEFTVVLTVGSGYDRTATTFNFSPNGAYQSTATRGSIKIQRRTDGATVRVFSGGSAKGFTPVTFTPDSSAIAVWASSPNQTTLWRISDGAVLRRFRGASPEEGVGAIRFTLDGARLVTSGYLPFVDAEGLWQQVGIIRFWRVADGALRQQYDQHTGIGVTSPIAFSPDGTRFAYGTYEGTAVVARTPAP